MAQRVKNPPTGQETWIRSLGQEDPLEEKNGNPFQYSCLKKIPWTEEPGGLQFTGSQRETEKRNTYS